MRRGHVDRCWKYLVFDFGLYVSEISLFKCSSLMLLSVVPICSYFRTMCGQLNQIDVFLVNPFSKSTGEAIVTEANLCCFVFFCPTNVSSQY